MTNPDRQLNFKFRFFGQKEGHLGETDLPGHLIPSLIYFALGASFLWLALQRARDLPNHPGKSFAELYIPEKSSTVLRTFSRALIGTCIIGLIEHTAVGIYNEGGPFLYLGHQVMYFGMVVVGLTAELESQKRLPPDSFRMSFALALFVISFMMKQHAMMKPSMVDGKFHEFWAQINLANSIVLAYSVRYPKSVVAFVMGWALMILTSTWLITIGIWSCCWDVETHMVGTHLGLQTFVIALVIILVTAYCCPSFEDSVEDQSEYSPLEMKGVDNDNEDDQTGTML